MNSAFTFLQKCVLKFWSHRIHRIMLHVVAVVGVGLEIDKLRVQIPTSPLSR